jgi:oligopeptide transport system substrate-binding protein
MVYEGLTRLLPGGELELALADRIDISEDGLVYRFHLRDALWSDGHPITAEDFAYSWKKVLDPVFGAPSAVLFYPILNAPESIKGLVSPETAGIRVLDEKTLEITLSHPAPFFLSLISFCPFYPIPKHIEIANPNWLQAAHETLVSSGPYRLKKWERNVRVSIEKNPLYWDKENVFLNGIDILIISDEKTALRMYERGEIDILNSLTSHVAIDDFLQYKQQNRLELKPIGGTFFCPFNLNSPILQNRNVRKALSNAINRASIVENISQLNETIASAYVPPCVNGNQAQHLIPSFDPELAQKQLAEGLTELGANLEAIDLTISYENNDLGRRIALALHEGWKEILGIDVKLNGTDHKTLMHQLETRRFSIALTHWLVHYLDPTSILNRFKYKESKKNYPGYENQVYISYLDQAQSTNDPIQRSKLLDQAESVIVDDMPLTPLFHYNQAILKNSRFQDVTFTPIGDPIYKTIRPAGS